MRESIFFSSLRSFFTCLFGMTGVLIGLLLGISLIGLLGSSADKTPDKTYTPEIIANASGVRKALASDSPVLLRLNITGVIGGEGMDMSDFRTQLIESREGTLGDNRVKGLLLYIQSPGGTVVDADGIYRAVKAYKEQYKVPVIAYVDGLCASGGMYVACAADKIYASDVSIVGSVGVVTAPFMNFTQLMDKVGVQSLTLSAGKDKDEMNPFRPWKENESQNIQDLINYYYNDFVNIVVSNRPKLDKEKLIKDYGAHIFPASQAAEFGYIDGSGVSYNAVLKMLATDAGLNDDNYQVMQMSKPWYSSLFKSEFGLFRGVIKHRLELSAETDPGLNGKFLYLYRP